jgi:hypothetical protein
MGVSMKKLALALGCTVLFIVLLMSFHFIHMRFLPVNVVLFSALIDALIAACVTTALTARLFRKQEFSFLEHALLIVIWLLGGYAFAISVPTIIDRSLSFYILEKLQQRGGAIRQASFEDIFRVEYLVEHRLVDVRLTEQLQSGTITITNGCVKLTDKGNQIADLSRFYRAQMLPRQRLLMGQYSNALVDPFRSSDKEKDYKC